MLWLYNTLLVPVRLAVGLRAALSSRDPGKTAEWDERRARRLPATPPGSIWIHGASVGEVGIVNSLAAEIRRTAATEIPLVVSALTPTGRQRLAGPPEVDAAFFLPLDFPGTTRTVFRKLQPSVLTLVETELWPNLLEAAQSAEVPVVIVNGRLSSRRMKRYRRLSPLYRPRLRRLAHVGAQSPEDAERFVELGVPRSVVSVTGNIKYDLPPPAATVASEIRARLRLDGGRPVFIAASTRDGEESLLLDAVAAVRKNVPNLLWILAPRHLERVETVVSAIEGRGLRHRLWSDTSTIEDFDVLIVDTLGQLRAMFAIADVAFVGGTLVPIGGHNVLEPAAANVPVLFGPHTENVTAAADALCAADGAIRVQAAKELIPALGELLGNEDRRRRMGRSAGEVVRSNRGALARSVESILAAAR